MPFIIADNQELTRLAIEHVLDGYGNQPVVTASNKSELVRHLKNQEESVVILDYTLFDFFDVQNLLIVSQRFPITNWILLSDDLTEPFLRSVVYQSQRFSILFKDCSIHELSEAIRHALQGKRYLSQRVTEILLNRQIHQDELTSALTATEVEIVRCIAQGKTTKEIASERFSSIHTINTHRKNIFRKLHVNTAYEAIKVALRAGLIDGDDYFI